jgi:hypothetical protein
MRGRRGLVAEQAVSLAKRLMKRRPLLVRRHIAGKPGAGLDQQSLRLRLLGSVTPNETGDRSRRFEAAGPELGLRQLDERRDSRIVRPRRRCGRP